LTACLHTDHALVPTANHFTCPYLEAERIVAVARAVELLALVIRSALRIQPACVVNDSSLARRDRRALAVLTAVIPRFVGVGALMRRHPRRYQRRRRVARAVG
jgi:hypothetical protein